MNWHIAIQLVFALVCDVGLLAAGHTCAQRWGITTRVRSPLPIALLLLGIAMQAVFALLHEPFLPAAAVQVAIAAIATSAAFDAQTGYIFDAITLPAIVLIFVLAFFTNALPDALIGSLAAGGAMSALYLFSRGRGMGLGDVKIACCIGAAFGAPKALQALGFAFIAGGFYAAVVLITRRARRDYAVPFGPFIALGAFAALACGSPA